MSNSAANSVWGREGVETTGLPDDYDFTIKQSYFAPNAQYANGEVVLLQWYGVPSGLDDPKQAEWADKLWFPVGKGWVSKDGGKSVVREDGKDTFFAANSLMYKLIARCRDDFGIIDLISERGNPELPEGVSGTPFDATVWEGLTFRIKREKFDYGKLEVDPKPFPAKFVGAADASAVASSNGAATSNGGSNVEEQVREVFRNSADHQSAQTAALQIPGATENSELLAQILDPSSYAALKA